METRRALALEQWVLQDLGLGQQCQVPFCNLYTKAIGSGAVKVGSGCSDHLQSHMLQNTFISAVSLGLHRQLSSCGLPESPKEYPEHLLMGVLDLAW